MQEIMNTEQTTTHDQERPPQPTRWQVAIHEAAHAAYAHQQDIGVSYVTIEGIVAAENGDDPGEYLGRCYYSSDGEVEEARTGLLGCALSLVGPAAQHKVGWAEDLLLPYGEFLQVAVERHLRSDAGHVLTNLRLAEEPKVLYEAACKEAQAFVEEHWGEIVALAEKLMEAVSLSSSQISAVLGPGWFEFRKMLDEMALEDDLEPWMKAAMEAAGTDDPGDISIGPDGGPIPVLDS